jgi:hypothetical protein
VVQCHGKGHSVASIERPLLVLELTQSKDGFSIEEVQEAVVHSCSAAAGSPALVRLKGGANRDITLALNRFSKKTKEVVFTDPASEDSVVRRS